MLPYVTFTMIINAINDMMKIRKDTRNSLIIRATSRAALLVRMNTMEITRTNGVFMIYYLSRCFNYLDKDAIN